MRSCTLAASLITLVCIQGCTLSVGLVHAGLTKVPIDGQPASIVQDLDDMARSYVKGDNAIILAVSPANADLATSDALRMARDVDPTGDRTIGTF